MSPQLRRLLLVAVSMTAAACHGLSEQERESIDLWLTCQECDGGQLDSIVALAGRKPLATRDTIIEDLLRGPSQARRDHLGAQLDSSFSELASSQGPLPIDRAIYAQHYLANFVASYRLRASIALATIGIGDSVALGALDSAAADPELRADARAVVIFARDSIWEP